MSDVTMIIHGEVDEEVSFKDGDGEEMVVEEETVEVEETVEISLEEIVREISQTVFGKSETITAYKIAKVINGVFETVGNEKRIPPQMMYNYSSKGMIVKGYKGKEYTFDQTVEYVMKYTSKHVN